MKQLVRGLRAHTEALIAAATGLLVAFTAVALLGPEAASPGSAQARWLVNLFKFMLGLYSLAIGFYFFYGPALNRKGIATSIMPRTAPPLVVPVTFATLGGAVLLMAAAIVRPGFAHVLFWRIVGFAILGALITGLFVYNLNLHVDVDDDR